VQQLPVAQGFEEMAQWSLRMFTSEEAAEGMAAFREKRKPAWVKED
jgi:methylglutaconyl-CoA hydratase